MGQGSSPVEACGSVGIAPEYARMTRRDASRHPAQPARWRSLLEAGRGLLTGIGEGVNGYPASTLGNVARTSEWLIGLGVVSQLIGIGIGIGLTDPIFAKLLVTA